MSLTCRVSRVTCIRQASVLHEAVAVIQASMLRAMQCWAYVLLVHIMHVEPCRAVYRFTCVLVVFYQFCARYTSSLWRVPLACTPAVPIDFRRWGSTLRTLFAGVIGAGPANLQQVDKHLLHLLHCFLLSRYQTVLSPAHRLSDGISMMGKALYSLATGSDLTVRQMQHQLM